MKTSGGNGCLADRPIETYSSSVTIKAMCDMSTDVSGAPCEVPASDVKGSQPTPVVKISSVVLQRVAMDDTVVITRWVKVHEAFSNNPEVLAAIKNGVTPFINKVEGDGPTLLATTLIKSLPVLANVRLVSLDLSAFPIATVAAYITENPKPIVKNLMGNISLIEQYLDSPTVKVTVFTIGPKDSGVIDIRAIYHEAANTGEVPPPPTTSPVDSSAATETSLEDQPDNIGAMQN